MKDKKNKTVLITVLVLLFFSFIILKINQIKTTTTQTKQKTIVTKQKLNQQSLNNIKKLVKIYLDNNINKLSPKQPARGGKFLITKLSFLDKNKIKIEYTDGHNEYIARAHYLIGPHQPLLIDNFKLLMKNKTLIIQTDNKIAPDDLSVIAIKEKLATTLNYSIDTIKLSNLKKINHFWRGDIAIQNTDINTPFWAVLNNREYTVFSELEKTDTTLCQKLIQNNFPNDLILECL